MNDLLEINKKYLKKIIFCSENSFFYTYTYVYTYQKEYKDINNYKIIKIYIKKYLH